MPFQRWQPPSQPVQSRYGHVPLPSEQVGGPQPPASSGSPGPTATDIDPNPMMSPSALNASQTKPDSQSSAGSNIPAWTALATTSDEEDGMRSDSRATTPEPNDELISDSASARRPPRRDARMARSSSQKAARGAFSPTLPFAVINSFNDPVTNTPLKPTISMPLLWLPPPGPSSVARPSHSPSKRRPVHSPPDASGKPPEKRRKHAPSTNIIRIPPMTLPAKHQPPPPRIKLVFSKFMAEGAPKSAPDNATATQDNAEGTSATPGSASHHIEAGDGMGSSAPRVVASAAPSRHSRPQKQRLVTDDAITADETFIDEALDTHVSAIRILPQYAQSPKGDARDVVRLHVALRSFESGSIDKGKRRAHTPWSIPRWSKAGEFKERLDSFYGPGDINRGLGRGPANRKRPSADEDVFATAPDVTVPLDQSDGAVASGTALTEDEDDTDALLQGMRRGRLENPSPGKGTRTSQRPATRDSSPEIV